MKNLFLATLITFNLQISFPQVTIKIQKNNDPKVSLLELEGEKISFVDSIYLKNAEEIHFNLENRHEGMYRVNLSNNKWLDFVYDNKEVFLETNVNNLTDSLKVLQSESNKIYHKFTKLNKEYKTKTELVRSILVRYPKDDDYYQTTKEKLIYVQEEYLNFVKLMLR